MKANQSVSEVYYQGFNTDLEGVGVGGCSRFKCGTVTYVDQRQLETCAKPLTQQDSARHVTATGASKPKERF